MTLHHLAQLAQKAGIADRLLIDDWPELKRFADAVAEFAALEEREACAKSCESRYMGDNNREDMEARRCAAAIRARGTK
jgi:hypothetical protein